MNINELEESELLKIQTDIDARLEAFRVVKVTAELEALAATIGKVIILKDPCPTMPTVIHKTKAPPKYRSPDNRRHTWSGNGLQPEWLSDKLLEGCKLEDFLI
jgi:DNA-binding protein H-NS